MAFNRTSDGGGVGPDHYADLSATLNVTLSVLVGVPPASASVAAASAPSGARRRYLAQQQHLGQWAGRWRGGDRRQLQQRSCGQHARDGASARPDQRQLITTKQEKGLDGQEQQHEHLVLAGLGLDADAGVVHVGGLAVGGSDCPAPRLAAQLGWWASPELCMAVSTRRQVGAGTTTARDVSSRGGSINSGSSSSNLVLRRRSVVQEAAANDVALLLPPLGAVELQDPQALVEAIRVWQQREAEQRAPAAPASAADAVLALHGSIMAVSAAANARLDQHTRQLAALEAALQRAGGGWQGQAASPLVLRVRPRLLQESSCGAAASGLITSMAALTNSTGGSAGGGGGFGVVVAVSPPSVTCATPLVDVEAVAVAAMAGAVATLEDLAASLLAAAQAAGEAVGDVGDKFDATDDAAAAAYKEMQVSRRLVPLLLSSYARYGPKLIRAARRRLVGFATYPQAPILNHTCLPAALCLPTRPTPPRPCPTPRHARSSCCSWWTARWRSRAPTARRRRRPPRCCAPCWQPRRTRPAWRA